MSRSENHDLNIGLDLAFEGGNPAAAELFLREACRLNPRDLYATEALAVCLAKLGRHPEAIQIADAFLRRNIRYVNAHVLAGDVRRMNSDYVAAIESYDGALTLSSNNADALIGKALCYVHLGHHAGIVDELWARIPATFTSFEAEVVRLNVLLRHEGKDRALERIREFEDSVSQSAYGRRWLAIYYGNLGDFESALRYAPDPSGDISRSQREEVASILLKAGEYEQALEQMGPLQPSDSWQRFSTVGSAQLGLDRVEDSLQSLLGSIERGATNSITYRNAFIAAIKCMKFGVATSLAVKGVKRCPEDEKLYTYAWRVSSRLLRIDVMVFLIWHRTKRLILQRRRSVSGSRR